MIQKKGDLIQSFKKQNINPSWNLVDQKLKEKLWFVIIDEYEEGPFSIEDLLDDLRITEETLAWKEGLSEWLPIKKIAELAPFFKKKRKKSQFDFSDKEDLPLDEEIVIDHGVEPPKLWLLVVALLLVGLTWMLLRGL